MSTQRKAKKSKPIPIIETREAKPIFDAEGRLRLSFSAVDTWHRCGNQFKLRYLDGIKSIPGIALLEGSSHHKALEMNNLSKRDKGFDLAHAQLTDIFMDDFRTRVKAEEQINWEDENEDKIYTRAKVLHEKYTNDLAPGIKPVEVEKRFELLLDLADERGKNPVKVLLVGVADLETEPAILDYKTAAKSKGQSEADHSLQLSLYAYATKKKQVGIIELLKKANPDVGMLISTRSAQQKLWALQVVRSVALAIKTGVFPLAAPNTWGCSARFCGFWSRCRGRFA